jgi:cell division transport system ATP-binding protein
MLGGVTQAALRGLILLVSASPFIEFRDVSVAYSRDVTGLDHLSLQIQRGEFTFFTGPTGAGKSTLLKVLTREVHHTDGEVRLGGQNLNDFRDSNVHKLRRQMGIVPQNYELLPTKRVWENLAYALRSVGKSRKEVRDEVPRILQQVNIAHRIDAYPHQLSGGEQQRVVIGRALINKPPLLIADEPTGNLDPSQSIEIMELLLGLNSEGMTVLIASHDMPVVERFAKRTVRLEHGRILAAEDRA